MRTLKLLFFLAVFFIAGKQISAQTYNLVWSDEFNGSIGPELGI